VVTAQPVCGVSGVHTAVGGYTIACSGGAAPNYTFDDTHTATLMVGPTTLTVIPAPQTVVYGQADPAFGYAIFGFQGSDGGSVVTTQPVCTVTGVHTAAGSYAIGCSGGSAPNYTFDDTHTATLTVTARPTPGSPPLTPPSAVVGLARAADGHGYLEAANDGGIFTFGDADFYGSMGGRALNKPIVGVAATADGHGYWLVASDGAIFTFGRAGFFGSAGSMHLNKPIVGMAATPDGRGYWLVASDGGLFTLGDAQFYGSTG
jgi:hypothetical protein